jgi:hypothetical protein
MSTMKHTPEPWEVNKMHVSADISHIGSCYGTGTSKEEDRANAARIVACVNACKGLTNEELQSNAVYAVIQERDELKKDVSSFKSELNKLLNAIEGGTKDGDMYTQRIGTSYINYLRDKFNLDQ